MDDASGASGYRVYRDGSLVDTTSATSTRSAGSRADVVPARRRSLRRGREHVAASTTASTALCAAPTGLVAAYSFDDGAGTVLSDTSGNGHNGTVSGATWTAGHDGGALSFDGTSASVDLGALGTFYQSGFTLEAWVKKQTRPRRTSPSRQLERRWADALGRPHRRPTTSCDDSGISNYLDSGQTPSVGQWQYLTATFDGSTARYYIDGTEVASRLVCYSSAAPTPGGSVPTVARAGFFDGLIDNVRIYNRALSAAEMQTDMTFPCRRRGEQRHGSTNRARQPFCDRRQRQRQPQLGWLDRQPRRRQLRRLPQHRLGVHALLPRARGIAQPTGTSFTDAGMAPGTYYYKVTAQDAAGNISGAPGTRRAPRGRQRLPPTAPGTLTANGGVSRVDLTWGSRPPTTSAVIRYDVCRATTLGLHPDAGEQDRAADRHELHRHRPRPPAPTTTRSRPRTPPGTPGLHPTRRGDRSRTPPADGLDHAPAGAVTGPGVTAVSANAADRA